MMRDEGRVGRMHSQLFTAILRDERSSFSAVGTPFPQNQLRRCLISNHVQMPQIHCTTRHGSPLSDCVCVCVLHGSHGLS